MSSKTVIATQGQSLMDIAIKAYGSVEGLVALAFANNLSVTALLMPGDELILPDTIAAETDIVTEYERTKYTPATYKRPQLGAFNNGFNNGFN